MSPATRSKRVKLTSSTDPVPTKRIKRGKPTLSIDDLPPEMICEVFRRLPLNELATCSLVNKRWYSIYSVFKVHRLTMFEPRSGRTLSDKWYHSGETIKSEEHCSLAMFGRLVNNSLLSNLKYLAVILPGVLGKGPWFRTYPFEFNQFAQLLHLEIQIDYGVKEVNLKLSKLKILKIQTSCYCPIDCALSIDCSDLRVLSYRLPGAAASSLQLKHPEKIEKLDTNMVGSELKRFSNVRCLATGRFEEMNMHTLRLLPRLEELHYSSDAFGFLNYLRGDAMDEMWVKLDQMRQAWQEFKRDAESLRGPRFPIKFTVFDLFEQLDEIPNLFPL